MSEGLLGVLIGGVIATIGTVVGVRYDWMKWKKEKKLEHLRDKRERLATLFRDVSNGIEQDMVADRLDLNRITNIRILCPQSVIDAFDSMIDYRLDQKEKSGVINISGLGPYFAKITQAMKTCLGEIDKQIEESL